MNSVRQYDTQPDEILAKWSQEGDEEAFSELIKRHSGKIYAKAWQLLRDEGEALEVSQEAWIKAWQKLEQFRGDATFTTWLTRIVINLCFDRIRRHRRINSRTNNSIEEMNEMGIAWESEIEQQILSPIERLEKQEMIELINEGLARLPEVQRLAIILHDIEGLEYKEVARIMGCSVGTVMSRLFYGRRRLAMILNKLQTQKKDFSS